MIDRRIHLLIKTVAGFTAMMGLVRAAGDTAPTLHLIGDSTMASYAATRPVHGWGQELGKFFRSELAIDNAATSGRSSKSFLAEGRWDKVLARLHPGDFVIIQFGHNDAKKEDAARYTEPRGSYRENLLRFVHETRAHGATPILATSVARRKWTDGVLVNTHGEYPVVTREVAAAEHVPLIDLLASTMELERELGVDGSKKLHLHLRPNEHPSQPNGMADDTHYSEYGATRVAALAASAIRRLGVPLSDWVRDQP
jgi:lysophospholipase L1-like esterase